MLFIKFPVAFEEFQNSEQFQDIILALVKSSSATAFKMEPINFFFFFNIAPFIGLAILTFYTNTVL